MKEDLRVFNLDENVYHQRFVPYNDWDTPAEFEAIADLVSRPPVSKHVILTANVGFIKHNQPASPLHRLPQELIDMIVGYMAKTPDGPSDPEPQGLRGLFALSTSCKFFHHLMKAVVTERMIAHIAPWAGKKIYTVGYNETWESHVTSRALVHESAYKREHGPAPWLRYIQLGMSLYEIELAEEMLYNPWLNESRTRRRTLEQPDRVLCNKDTCEYVAWMGPIYSSKDGRERDAFFGRVIVALTTVGSQLTVDPWSMRAVPWLNGRWAGNRLEIMRKSEMEQAKDAGWSDVTWNVNRELCQLTADMNKAWKRQSPPKPAVDKRSSV